MHKLIDRDLSQASLVKPIQENNLFKTYTLDKLRSLPGYLVPDLIKTGMLLLQLKSKKRITDL